MARDLVVDGGSRTAVHNPGEAIHALVVA